MMRSITRWALAGFMALAVLGAVGVAWATPGSGEVILKSQNTVGTRPDGSTVLIDIKLKVSGPTMSSLTGTGRHFGSGGTHAYWDVSGGITGNTMTLTGTVQETNNPLHLGSPIQVTADLTSEVVTFAFGPLTGGPFAGHTIVTHGPGRIEIRD